MGEWGCCRCCRCWCHFGRRQGHVRAAIVGLGRHPIRQRESERVLNSRCHEVRATYIPIYLKNHRPCGFRGVLTDPPGAKHLSRRPRV
eukprot:COSAG02_NODE_20414_length_833_cov_0.448229_1_plen_87_part_01